MTAVKCAPVPVCVAEIEPDKPARPGALPCWAKQDRYLYGDCYLLAQAAAALSGWQAVTVDMAGNNGHAMVKLPDGRLLDAAGLHDPWEPYRVYDRLESGARQDPEHPLAEWCVPDVLADAHELLSGLDAEEAS